ncbi:MAG: DUF86 domain-containing protein [Gallionella sp.]|nr:DUF86 domain-containing protein [Gallionella sp.]
MNRTEILHTLQKSGWITLPLANSLKNMVGFRNIAVHDYQNLQLPITSASSPPIWMNF